MPAIAIPAALAALLAAAVLGGLAHELDLAGMRAMHGAGAPGWELWAFAFTYMGGRVGAFMAAAAAALALLGARRRADAAGLGLSFVGALAIASVAKLALAVPRPAELPALIGALGSSFPSGHTLVAVAIYGYLGALAAAAGGWWRVVAAACFALPAAVMWSRLYLGVHWPTDVLGGALIGAAWVAWCLRWRAAIAGDRAEARQASDGGI